MQDAVLVTMDVRSLYINTKHNKGFSALREYHNKGITKNPHNSNNNTSAIHINIKQLLTVDTSN